MDTSNLDSISSVQQQIDKGYADADELNGICLRLHQISDAADSALLNGGLSSSARTELYGELSAIGEKAKLSFTIPERPDEGLKASMEETSRIVEYAKKAIQVLWNAILAAIKQLRQLAIHLYHQVFSEIARLERAAHGLMRKAAALQNASVPDEDLDIGQVIARYVTEDFNPHFRLEERLMTGLQTLGAYNKHICVDYFNAAKAQAIQIESFLKTVDPSSDASLRNTMFGVTAIKPIPLANCSNVMPASDQNATARATQRLLGGVQLVQETVDENSNELMGKTKEQFHIENVLGRARIYTSQYRVRGDVDTVIKVRQLSPAGMIQILSQVVLGCETIQQFKRGFADRERLSNELVKAGEIYKQKLDHSVGLAQGSVFVAQSVLSLPKYAVQSMDSPNVAWVAHATKVYASVFTLCEKLVELYSPK